MISGSIVNFSTAGACKDRSTNTPIIFSEKRLLGILGDVILLSPETKSDLLADVETTPLTDS